jgi:hypothetical protein
MCAGSSTCHCHEAVVTVQQTSPVVVDVITSTQSVQSTIVVRPGQGGAVGPQGVQGTQGTQGFQGTSGATLQIAYVHTQGVSSATWTITHNLNFYPNVTTMDSTGAICEGEIVYTNPNSLTVTFLAAFSGVAYLS